MTSEELRKRIPMRSISDFSKFPLAVRTPDFVLTSTDVGPPFLLCGHDRRGIPWHVILRDAVRGAWKSTLPEPKTYYFAGYTGGAGSAPDTWILALSFDDEGRPVPFFVTTHGGYDANGIEDVLNLDGSGPELLEQSYWRNIRNDSGYYVTVLYQLRNLYWYRVDGRHGTHVFPAFERWSVTLKGRPAELVTTPLSNRSVRDSSNDPSAGVRAELTGAEENRVRVKPEAGCESVAVELSVTDSPKGRTIDLEPETGSLAILAKAHASVVFTVCIAGLAVESAMPQSCGQQRIAKSNPNP